MPTIATPAARRLSHCQEGEGKESDGNEGEGIDTDGRVTADSIRALRSGASMTLVGSYVSAHRSQNTRCTARDGTTSGSHTRVCPSQAA